MTAYSLGTSLASLATALEKDRAMHAQPGTHNFSANSRFIANGQNLAQLLADRAATTPNGAAFMSKRNGEWQTATWQQVFERAEDIAFGLLSIGMQLGDRVAIIGNTRQEWSLCDFGLILGGGVTVPIYPSSLGETAAFILRNSESAWVFAENEQQLDKLLARRVELAHVKRIILWDGHVDNRPDAADWVMTLSELRERGREHRTAHKDALVEIREKVLTDSAATIIYTSGTTGMPKGVVVTHAAYTVGTGYVEEALPIGLNDRHVLFLPLSHSFGKLIEVICVKFGSCTAFAESLEKLADNCGEVKPTFVCAVPRVFEKAYSRVLNNAKEGGPIKWAIFQQALAVGLRYSRELQGKRQPGRLLAMEYALADKLVFSKLRARFGGQMRFFVCGSAPLSKDMAEFFHAAGMLILEGYGLTETNSLTSVNRVDNFKFGTVGKVVHADVTVRIAPDGEILTKGITNLQEYYKQPEATREAIDEQGWFHTGDIGEFDAEGFLKITDRKKDLMKTSGGKYVAPQMIESQLKIDPLISQVVVIGDQRKYVTALIALNQDVAKEVIGQSGGQAPVSTEDLLRHSALSQRVQNRIDAVNQKLGRWEQVKYFRFLPRELSEAEDEMTPTLKIKRKVVTERYRDLVESMYSEKSSGGEGGLE